MSLEKFRFNKKIIKILTEHGIENLYPPQEQALPYAMDGENVVLSIPTASGKSLVAYIAIVQKLMKTSGKALYIVPLKALAREKYEELKLFESIGFKVAISTGDLDDSDPRLGIYDIIVCTSEKADSLLRHGITWLDQIKVLVVDEIHLIHDPVRGPTLEVIISRFKSLNPHTQIIALSATIKNASELSEWIDAKLISSKWRPVILREGVYLKNQVKYNDGKIEKIDGNENKPVERLVENSIVNNGQVLVFVNTRRSAVSLATKLARVVEKNLKVIERDDLKKSVKNLKKETTDLTSIDEKLFYCIENGTAFHNAGLSSIQRRFIENAFKNHTIKCIVATPTLAAGINIPAKRVIIRDLWRYDSNFGMKPIPILEYKQQAGRAGRPRFDKEGESILIAKNNEQMEQIYTDYILGDTEEIYSKLGSEAALRMHLLSAIATSFVDDMQSIYKFIDSTFYAYQSESFALYDSINNVIEFLLVSDFIKEINGNHFLATPFGKRTSSLYIDPLSALNLKKALENTCGKDITSLSFLHAVCSTPDVRSLYLRKQDTWLEEKAEIKKSEFLINTPHPTSVEYEWFLSDLKTASLVEDWINEIHESRIVTKYNVGPGDIHNIIEMTSWLLNASREFARMYNFEYVSDITQLIMRVRYGCKKELINLVNLKGVGRIRARALFKNGFKTINDLRKIPINRIAKIKSIGLKMAKNIKNQIGESDGIEDKEIYEYDTK